MEARALRPPATAVSLPYPAPAKTPAWNLAEVAGRLVEISGSHDSAALTAAFGLVLDAQRAGEPVAWITSRGNSFFPPDAALGGVDLAALAVIRVADARTAGRAADQLARSGGFGLLVIDLGPGEDPRLSPPAQTRLVGLARKHDTAIVVISQKPADAPSLGSLVSLRAEARRGRGFECELSVLKDKRRGPGQTYVEVCRGPAGLF